MKRSQAYKRTISFPRRYRQQKTGHSRGRLVLTEAGLAKRSEKAAPAPSLAPAPAPRNCQRTPSGGCGWARFYTGLVPRPPTFPLLTRSRAGPWGTQQSRPAPCPAESSAPGPGRALQNTSSARASGPGRTLHSSVLMCAC